MVTAAQAVSTDDELQAWIDDRRLRLSRTVSRTSAPTVRLLEKKRATAPRLLALAAREIINPDWRSGFLNRCIIVVRDDLSKKGRLGLWEEDGCLCVETKVPEGILVLRGRSGELWLDEPIEPDAVDRTPSAIRGAAAGVLSSWRGRVTWVHLDECSGRTVMGFSLGLRGFSLRAS